MVIYPNIIWRLLFMEPLHDHAYFAFSFVQFNSIWCSSLPFKCQALGRLWRRPTRPASLTLLVTGQEKEATYPMFWWMGLTHCDAVKCSGAAGVKLLRIPTAKENETCFRDQILEARYSRVTPDHNFKCLPLKYLLLNTIFMLDLSKQCSGLWNAPVDQGQHFTNLDHDVAREHSRQAT